LEKVNEWSRPCLKEWRKLLSERGERELRIVWQEVRSWEGGYKGRGHKIRALGAFVGADWLVSGTSFSEGGERGQKREDQLTHGDRGSLR